MRLALVEKHPEIDDVLNQHGTFALIKELGSFLLLEIKNKPLWLALKAHARAEVLPPLWTSVDRLPPRLRAKAGAVAPDAKTVGDVLRDVTGDEDFGQEEG